jgi:hypothetical protein
MVCLTTLRRARSIEIVLLSLAFVGCAWSESGQMEEAFYARKELKQLAEHERKKRNINCALTHEH